MFNGPLSRTTRVSRYQKGKTNLDFTEARDSEWQWHQLGCMQVCISLQTENHACTPPLSFLQAGCPSCRPTNSVKALKASWQKTPGNEFTNDISLTFDHFSDRCWNPWHFHVLASGNKPLIKITHMANPGASAFQCIDDHMIVFVRYAWHFHKLPLYAACLSSVMHQWRRQQQPMLVYQDISNLVQN